MQLEHIPVGIDDVKRVRSIALGAKVSGHLPHDGDAALVKECLDFFGPIRKRERDVVNVVSAGRGAMVLGWKEIDDGLRVHPDRRKWNAAGSELLHALGS